jgi:hypothetical protein
MPVNIKTDLVDKKHNDIWGLFTSRIHQYIQYIKWEPTRVSEWDSENWPVYEKYKQALLYNFMDMLYLLRDEKRMDIFNLMVTPEFEFTNTNIWGEKINNMTQNSDADRILSTLKEKLHNKISDNEWYLKTQRDNDAKGGIIKKLEVTCTNVDASIKDSRGQTCILKDIWPGLQKNEVILEFDVDESVIEVRHKRAPLKSLIENKSGITLISPICRALIFEPCKDAGLTCDCLQANNPLPGWAGMLQCHLNVGRRVNGNDDFWDPFTLLEFYNLTMCCDAPISNDNKKIENFLKATAAKNSRTLVECKSKEFVKKLDEIFKECVKTILIELNSIYDVLLTKFSSTEPDWDLFSVEKGEKENLKVMHYTACNLEHWKSSLEQEQRLEWRRPVMPRNPEEYSELCRLLQNMIILSKKQNAYLKLIELAKKIDALDFSNFNPGNTNQLENLAHFLHEHNIKYSRDNVLEQPSGEA